MTAALPVSQAAADERVGPVSQRERVASLDVIRGAALFGVLIMNILHGFRLPYSYAPGVAQELDVGFDHVLGNVLAVLMADKAMTLFSVLFGAGLVLFHERASRRGPGAMKWLVRRLLVLLALGVLHSVFIWGGDILAPYAVMGLVALLFWMAPPRVLFVMGVLLSVVYPLMRWQFAGWFPQGGPAAVQKYQVALNVYAHGSYAQIVPLRAQSILHDRILFMALRGMPQILGNILVGMGLWRAGAVRYAAAHRRRLMWMAVVGIPVGAAAEVYRLLTMNSVSPTAFPLGRLLWNITVLPYALGYASVLLLLFQRPRAQAVLLRLAPLGRMAFTNYIVQSIVLTTLSYGYGLGLLGKVGAAPATAFGVVLYVAQVFASEWWLRRHRFGPLEWAWRALTYGHVP